MRLTKQCFRFRAIPARRFHFSQRAEYLPQRPTRLQLFCVYAICSRRFNSRAMLSEERCECPQLPGVLRFNRLRDL